MPNTVYDPDFCGIERHSEETCDHFEKLMKYVAFEGENTGRRFLGCARAVSTARSPCCFMYLAALFIFSHCHGSLSVNCINVGLSLYCLHVVLVVGWWDLFNCYLD